jgi:Rhodanese-related sulfurtransferase
MKSITIEEIEAIDCTKCCVVDLRPEEQYRRGTFPGAVNIPMEQFEKRKTEIPKEKTVCLLCHTGERSQAYTEELEKEGYDAANVNGGYNGSWQSQGY